ncbi:MAG: MFS transporter [Aquabacterium sp.]|uniref:MFS transporter n=1 Tax=Aquabacterium sp. TaxID=1872578 RepID=UPI00120668D7|nr:MFS transporter [Aquabacterium sp.]TAK95958.1 MAG: MFS transporter [Aquabacterium sp.]
MHQEARAAWRYGLMGLPLAFVSLPLYVQLPRHYAETHGLSLSLLGGTLLATRALDALVDPRIGQWLDQLFAQGTRRVCLIAAAAALLMWMGFAALWLPPADMQAYLPWWLGLSLILTYLGFSTVSMLHQTWAARWGGGALAQSRVLAWREGLALAGVLLASVLPVWLGLHGMVAVMALALLIGLAGLWSLQAKADPAPLASSDHMAATHTASPWSQGPFVILLLVFVLNGTASAIPATLLPFFVRDTLQAPAMEPLFLASYFLAAAVSLPLWVRIVRRWGAMPAWLAAMLLSVLAFISVPWLNAQHTWAFEGICLITGLAMGADLTIPGALLSTVIHQAGLGGRAEGRFFGWWTCASKLTLALASGIALPTLAWMGFQTGSSSPDNQQLLAIAYGGVPCLFKLAAALTLLLAAQRFAVLKGNT